MFTTVINIQLICKTYIYTLLNSRDVTAKRCVVDTLNKCGDFTQTIRQRLCINVETLHVIFQVDTLHIDGDFT